MLTLALLSCSGANVAQSVERIHGKDEVRGSIPRVGSNNRARLRRARFATPLFTVYYFQ